MINIDINCDSIATQQLQRPGDLPCQWARHCDADRCGLSLRRSRGEAVVQLLRGYHVRLAFQESEGLKLPDQGRDSAGLLTKRTHVRIMASMVSPNTLSPEARAESQPETASILAPPPSGSASIVRCMSTRPVPPFGPSKAGPVQFGAIRNIFWRNRSRRPQPADTASFRRSKARPNRRHLCTTVIPAKAGIQRGGDAGWVCRSNSLCSLVPSAAGGVGGRLLQCRRGTIAVLPGLRCECVASLLIESELPAMRSHKKQQFASIFGETAVRPGAPTRGRNPVPSPYPFRRRSSSVRNGSTLSANSATDSSTVTPLVRMASF